MGATSRNRCYNPRNLTSVPTIDARARFHRSTLEGDFETDRAEKVSRFALNFDQNADDG